MVMKFNVPVGAVVVGTDGSASSRRAVEWAAAEAAQRGVPALIVYVAEWAGMGFPGVQPVSERELLTLGEKLVTKELARVRAQFADVQVRGELTTGDASAVLIEASHRAGLVIVGARGLGPLAGRLLGAVSQKVAAHAAGPVMVVREEAPTEMPGPVVVGADPADPAVEVLRFAFEEARRRGVGVVVVAAVRQFRTTLRSDLAAAENLDRAEQDRQQLTDLVTHLAAEHEIHAEAQYPDARPADALLTAAGAESLIVVGSRGRASVAEVALGSVTTAVISRAMAVAVVRVPPSS
ncbi:universal stress protein UspA-like protein [Brachybacterium faecium DSM 4810]|uniref:Universal stress protein UspA-like protein n=1 Tax=Brachybacterium faecium (strain ATCC 43885 / DSM 4810 / JCM 11609 / LMG 19847 / NBRC 14762 / NCIMB 9860 / 6-10) TaxID=446465 RepID=C7MHG2_BRAFD|nr:universal stress protein [Brachybacterium faecium]ACU84371.1 universal stress protein UspA-like protein [Brachybacterium faecium DSM 4810]